MGSGLIYALLIGMWAVYFIPRWLRRHEELSESRSIERFDRAMRILSRKDPTPDRALRRHAPAAGRDGGTERGPLPGPAAPAAPTVQDLPAAALPRWRSAGGGCSRSCCSPPCSWRPSRPLTAVPWWCALAGLGVVLGYLVHCRLQARTRHQVDRTRAAVRQRSRSRLMRFDAIERLMTVRRELAEERAADQRRWDEAEAAERAVREEEERRRAEAEAGWNPVPVPLPTYVSKPVAPRRAATVEMDDVTAGGAARSGSRHRRSPALPRRPPDWTGCSTTPRRPTTSSTRSSPAAPSTTDRASAPSAECCRFGSLAVSTGTVRPPFQGL